MNCENANGVNIDCDFIGDTIEFKDTLFARFCSHDNF